MNSYKQFKTQESDLSQVKYNAYQTHLIYGEAGRNPSLKDHYNPCIKDRSSFGKSDAKDFEKLADSGFRRAQGRPIDTYLENTNTFNYKKEEGRTFQRE